MNKQAESRKLKRRILTKVYRFKEQFRPSTLKSHSTSEERLQHPSIQKDDN